MAPESSPAAESTAGHPATVNPTVNMPPEVGTALDLLAVPAPTPEAARALAAGACAILLGLDGPAAHARELLSLAAAGEIPGALLAGARALLEGLAGDVSPHDVREAATG